MRGASHLRAAGSTRKSAQILPWERVGLMLETVIDATAFAEAERG